jgi:hypothetical protein
MNIPKPGELWQLNCAKLSENDFDLFLVISVNTENYVADQDCNCLDLLIISNLGIRKLLIYPPHDVRYKRL